AAITTQVEVLFQNQEVFHPTHVKVMTENQTVYLMGKVTKREADKAATTSAKAKGVRKVVKLFDYLKTRPAAEIERDNQRRIAEEKQAELDKKRAELEAEKAKIQQQINILTGTNGTVF
ncbi:MAG: BON domain-containing protein, partial [Candidatus Thioglobus sp.]